MSRVCDLTGKKVRSGKNVSFSNRHTARTFEPNLQSKKVWVPELGKFVKLKLSARAIRTIDRKGLLAALKSEGKTLKDVLA
jgi:large subunit ribosomal protein L28